MDRVTTEDVVGIGNRMEVRIALKMVKCLSPQAEAKNNRNNAMQKHDTEKRSGHYWILSPRLTFAEC